MLYGTNRYSRLDGLIASEFMEKPEKARQEMFIEALSARSAPNEERRESAVKLQRELSMPKALGSLRTMRAGSSDDCDLAPPEQVLRLLIADVRRSFIAGDAIEASRLARQALPLLAKARSIRACYLFEELAPALAIPAAGACPTMRALRWLAQRQVQARSKGLIAHKRTHARRPRMLIYGAAAQTYVVLAAGIIRLVPYHSIDSFASSASDGFSE